MELFTQLNLYLFFQSVWRKFMPLLLENCVTVHHVDCTTFPFNYITNYILSFLLVFDKEWMHRGLVYSKPE